MPPFVKGGGAERDGKGGEEAGRASFLHRLIPFRLSQLRLNQRAKSSGL